MKTKNTYIYPIEERHINNTRKDSPAHIKYQSKKTGGVYDLREAVDFLCSEGTPVCAAHSGNVVKTMTGLTKKWDKLTPPPETALSEEEQDGNYVLIEHPNSEFSIYSHLSAVQVKEGQDVQAGEQVGLSGDIGWSIKPHLHFMVFRFTRPMPAKDFESLEIRWKYSQ